VEFVGVELAQLNQLPDTSIATTLMDEEYMALRDGIDFAAFADLEKLEDGEAKQRLRALEDALRVAKEEHILAQDQLEGQRRLAARGFITPRELEAEELKVIRREVGLQSAMTDLALYTQYTFPKEAEQQLASYEEAIMEFQRKRKEGEAKIAQDQARFKSAERKFNMEVEKLADLDEQIEFTVIRAERPGLVVYGSAEQNSRPFRGGMNQEPIQEGATVRERQPILTIPDMTEMAVRVNIHESAVKRVSVGQKVIVTVDAFANVELTGEVIKVAVVADSANAFVNPDLKVYPTMVRVDGIHDWLRPGMSAEVEIQVETLTDVVYIPIQAVTYFEDQQVVYVTRGGRAQMREVKVGSFSELYIEISSGLEEGEKVMLLPPRGGLL